MCTESTRIDNKSLSKNNESSTENKALKYITLIFFSVVLLSNSIFLFVSVMQPALGGKIYKVEAGMEQYIGLSFSAAIALLVVLSLSYVAGEIEFEVFSFKFKGASGPVILWIICFLALITGMVALQASHPSGS